MFLQAVIEEWQDGLAIKRKLQHRLKTCSHIGKPFCFDFESEERANNNQEQNTVTSQRGAEASSRSKRNKWGVARRGDLFMPDLSLNSLERSATGLRC
jgi:hypothetical protein